MIQSLQDELGRMHARITNTVNVEPISPTFDAPSANNILPMSTSLGVSSTQSLEQNNPYADAIKAFEVSASDKPALTPNISSSLDMATSPDVAEQPAPYAPQPPQTGPRRLLQTRFSLPRSPHSQHHLCLRRPCRPHLWHRLWGVPGPIRQMTLA